MHVKIQGGGDGVYANSGSCVAAAMYCEHERQVLIDKGLKPEAFFHQYSDFVSTNEVIERIDNNKKKLRKEERVAAMTEKQQQAKKDQNQNSAGNIEILQRLSRGGLIAGSNDAAGKNTGTNSNTYPQHGSPSISRND